MIVVAFACFVLLVVAWMVAPSTAPVENPEPGPALQVGEAPA